MKIWYFGVNSLVLCFSVVASVLAAFWFVRAFLPPDRLAYQTPLAVVIAIGLYLAWVFLQHKAPPLQTLKPKTRKDQLVFYLLSFVWTPFVLGPLQFLAQGTTITLANLTVLWWFQFPVGLVMVLAAGYVFRIPGTPSRKIFRK